MHPNEIIIQRFYSCFQLKDYKGMQDCYAKDARFSDEAFVNLDGEQVRAMWEMLVKRGKDLDIRYSDITATDQEGSATWIATYSFGTSARPVTNRIRAHFRFAQGKITDHTDQFNFYAWSRQALGLPGILLGWSGYLRKKVQRTARKSLDDFMQKKQLL